MTVKLCDQTQKPTVLFKLIDPLKQKTGIDGRKSGDVLLFLFLFAHFYTQSALCNRVCLDFKITTLRRVESSHDWPV